MSKPKFDPNKPFQAEKPKFDPTAPFEAEQAEQESFGSNLLRGLVKTAEAIDSYTGVPIREAEMAAMDGAGTWGTIKAGLSGFGKDPKQAPTDFDVVKKMGVPDKIVKTGNLENMSERLSSQSPGQLPAVINPAEAAAFVHGAAADPTLVLPIGKIAKGTVKGAANIASKAVNVASDTLSGAGKLASRAGKRTIQGLFGVPEASINRYLARHPQLKDKVGAREMAEELAGRLDEGLKPARARLEAAEEAVARAKASRTEDLAELQIKRQEATEALRRAEDSALGEAASRVASRVGQLDENIKAGSSKAFEILDREGVVVPTQGLKARMTAGISALEERAVTDEQMAVVELLKRYRERLNKFGNEIPGGEAKRIIQSLDREMAYLAPGEIGRMSKPDQALGALRKQIDTPLKKSDAYASQMAEVSRGMQLLENVKGLSSESAAARALRAAKGATGKDKAEALQKLAAEFGDDFLAAANRTNLPEYHKLKSLLYRVREAKKGLPVKEAEAALEATRGSVGDAVALGKNGIAGITDKISATVRRTDPSALQTENLVKAGDLAGVNMADELADVRTIASFERGYNRGSANTNFWGAIVGGLLGSVLGPAGIVGGAATGGALGRIVIDNFGPRVGRVILDQVPRLNKVKPAEWIRSLDVPADVKAKLASDLAAYQQVSKGVKGTEASLRQLPKAELRMVADENREEMPLASTALPAGNRELKGEQLWMARGLSKLGIKDQATAQKLMQSKEGKRLLIEASDLPPNSKALKRILERIEKGGIK